MTVLHPSHTTDTDLPHWREEALCRDEQNAEFFFPGGDRGQTLSMTNAARAVCNGCAVRVECLLYATETQQEYGVWGGKTEPERRRLLRNLRGIKSPEAAVGLLLSL